MKKRMIAWATFYAAIVLTTPFLTPPALEAKKADPSEGKRLFRYYCAVCHGIGGKGDGVNSENLTPLPWDLTDREYMSVMPDQYLFDIIRGGGPAKDRSVYMPPWGKTLSEWQIQSLVAYIRFLSSGGPVPELARVMGAGGPIPGGKPECSLCHVKNRKYKPIAPNLAYAGSKLNRNWLLGFLKSPNRVRPVGYVPLTKSTMPNFQLREEEAEAVADYLMTLKDEGITPEVLSGLDLSTREVRIGQRLFARSSCIACHRVEGRGGIYGPDLTAAAERLRPEWIFRWIQNPQAIEPESPMPHSGLSDDRIQSLVAYILSLSKKDPSALAPPREGVDLSRAAKGGKIIQSKNCIFCHKMESVNSAKERKGMS